MHWISVAAFGALGVLSRYGIQVLFSEYIPLPPYWGTFLINTSGSFLIGLAYVQAVERGLLASWVGAGLMAGFLGGFTTFSTFSLELVTLLERGRVWIVVGYSVFSVLLGLLAAWLGCLLGRTVVL